MFSDKLGDYHCIIYFSDHSLVVPKDPVFLSLIKIDSVTQATPQKFSL